MLIVFTTFPTTEFFRFVYLALTVSKSEGIFCKVFGGGFRDAVLGDKRRQKRERGGNLSQTNQSVEKVPNDCSGGIMKD